MFASVLAVACRLRNRRGIVCRLSLAVLTVVGACTAGSYAPVLSGDGPDGDAPDLAARQEFESSVRSLYHAECGSECHETGLMTAPVFGFSYDDLTRYGDGSLLACDPTATSLILTKGVHDPGVAFQAASSTLVREWVDLWASVSPRCAALRTKARSGPFVPNVDGNVVSLAPLGPGLEAATMAFSAQRVAGGLYLTSIRLNAGAAGLHVVAPRFEACLAQTATPDPGNAFAALDLEVPPNGSVLLGSGALSITGWQAGDAVSVGFAEITPMAGSQGPPVDNGGSCGGGS